MIHKFNYWSAALTVVSLMLQATWILELMSSQRTGHWFSSCLTGRTSSNMTQLSSVISRLHPFVLLLLCCVLMAVCHQLAATTSQCGDHTGPSWQMTCHIEHITVIGNRLGKRKSRSHSETRWRIYACRPQLLSLSKHSPKGSGVGGVGGDGCSQETGPNRTTQCRLETRK